MKSKLFATILAIALATGIKAGPTIPASGHVINADDPGIQYVGRVDFTNPQRPAFNFPGTEIRANFEGTSLKMIARPMSGYFMVSIDSCEAFKVSLNCPADSVVTLATALRDGRHSVRIAYAMEGLDTHPEFWGHRPRQRVRHPPAHSTPRPPHRVHRQQHNLRLRCGEYGEDSTLRVCHREPLLQLRQPRQRCPRCHPHVDIAQWHRCLPQLWRRAHGSRDCMPQEFRNTLFADSTRHWDYSRWQPDVVCINLGTNDFSTDNYDASSTSRPTASFLPRCVASTPRRRSFSSPVRCSVRRRTASRRPSSTSYRRKVASTATRMSIA